MIALMDRMNLLQHVYIGTVPLECGSVKTDWCVYTRDRFVMDMRTAQMFQMKTLQCVVLC